MFLGNAWGRGRDSTKERKKWLEERERERVRGKIGIIWHLKFYFKIYKSLLSHMQFFKSDTKPFCS